MDRQELESLLAVPESDRIERKASFADKDRICEAICAFANDLPDHRGPGYVLVGLNDDGSPSGLPVTDQLLLQLAALRANGNIYPFPLMTVQSAALDGGSVAVVEVQPSTGPPVRFRGRTWVRVGPRRAIATPEEERRLTEKRRRFTLPFDLSPVPLATIDDLDLALFRSGYLPKAVSEDVLLQNARPEALQLSSLRLTTIEAVPTVTGILVLAKDPRRHIACAHLQFVRFAGTSATDDIKAHHEISGPLAELLLRVDAVLEANVSTAVDVTSGPLEARHPDFPLVALRQLVWNAVLHRTYEGTNAPVRVRWLEDRVEIQSPGGPFGQVTRQNFGEPGVADYRNPNLAEAMRTLGFVQKFGIGIELAREAARRNGNPPPEFVVEDTYVLATIRKRS